MEKEQSFVIAGESLPELTAIDRYNYYERSVKIYRGYILACKRKYGTARSQVHYHGFIAAYLEAKKNLLEERQWRS